MIRIDFPSKTHTLLRHMTYPFFFALFMCNVLNIMNQNIVQFKVLSEVESLDESKGSMQLLRNFDPSSFSPHQRIFLKYHAFMMPDPAEE